MGAGWQPACHSKATVCVVLPMLVMAFGWDRAVVPLHGLRVCFCVGL